MAKRAEVKIYDNVNELIGWELEHEINLEPLWDIKYGENPQQSAGILKSDGMADFEIMDNKSLSYNEVLTVTEIVNILSEFYDVCAAVIARHAAPCGVALAPDITEAYNKAFDCNPMASFYGAIGFSQKVNLSVAEHLSSMSVRVVIAPDYDKSALDLLTSNPLIKVVKLNTPLNEYKNIVQKDIHVTPFGTIYQDFDKSCLGKDSFKVVTKAKPTQEQIEDAVFAWKVAKYARSNSVVVAKNFKTTAIAQGFISQINAVEAAMSTACDEAKDAIMASDNVLPSIDCIHAAVQSRIGVIIQPGGSSDDEKLIKEADKYNLVMILTGIRNYKH